MPKRPTRSGRGEAWLLGLDFTSDTAQASWPKRSGTFNNILMKEMDTKKGIPSLVSIILPKISGENQKNIEREISHQPPAKISDCPAPSICLRLVLPVNDGPIDHLVAFPITNKCAQPVSFFWFLHLVSAYGRSCAKSQGETLMSCRICIKLKRHVLLSGFNWA